MPFSTPLEPSLIDLNYSDVLSVFGGKNNLGISATFNRTITNNVINEIGHRTASLCHLLVITRRLGRRLKWDPEKEVFPGDDEANALLDRPRRKGWELPKLS